MKMLFTGATGVIGRAAVPLLTAAGHEVIAVSRSETNWVWLRDVGAHPKPVDLFDRDAVLSATVGMDAVIHYATSIPPQATMTDRESWRMNDRLRSEATANLVDAAIANGVERFVQQSITFIYGDGAENWLDESSPIDPVWDVLDSALAAEGHVGRFSELGRTGVVLRMARMYGPGPVSADYISAVRAREVPIIGKGDNYVSSIHSDDVATALVFGVSAPAGTYNVADDEPMTAAEVINTLVDQLGVTRPPQLPISEAPKVFKHLTVSQRVANNKYKGTTGWAPRFASVSEGWADVVGRK